VVSSAIAAAYHASVDAFFAKMKTPVDHATEDGSDDRHRLNSARSAGCVCAMARFVILLIADSQSRARPRVLPLFIGGAIGGIGAMLLRAARRSAAGA
jgi:hypothetical protein